MAGGVGDKGSDLKDNGEVSAASSVAPAPSTPARRPSIVDSFLEGMGRIAGVFGVKSEEGVPQIGRRSSITAKSLPPTWDPDGLAKLGINPDAPRDSSPVASQVHRRRSSDVGGSPAKLPRHQRSSTAGLAVSPAAGAFMASVMKRSPAAATTPTQRASSAPETPSHKSSTPG